jgi:hypothetical protein
LNKQLWVCAVVGALVGAAAVQTFHTIHDRRNEDRFKEGLRCKALADKYVKDNASDSKGVVVNRVEFSRGRNSCILSVVEHFSTAPLEQAFLEHGLPKFTSPPLDNYTVKVVDLLTGEELFSRMCNGSNECAQTLQKQEDVFKDAR